MLPKSYSSTPNKERVRQEDSILVKKERGRKDKPLSYLGMPSGEMKDIAAWQKYFDRCTAVEVDENQRRQLVFNLMKKGLQGKVDVLFGDIQDILLKGKDEYNNKLVYPYDVIFLDFFGTLLYKDFKRVDAIDSLLNKQKKETFLFLLTFNLRERKYCKHAVKDTFSKIETDLLKYYPYDKGITEHVKNVIDWYCTTADESFRQKLFVPYYLKTRGELNGFNVHCYAPIFYLGHKKSPMIHFAFKFMSDLDSPLKVVSNQSHVDIFNLNLKIASKGRIYVAKNQAPRMRIE